MKSGTIFLYNEHDEILEQGRYMNITQRRNMIAKWRKLNNPNGYVQIDTRSPFIRVVKKIVKSVIPDKPKEPIKRFPAIYDNNKSLYPELNDLPDNDT